MFRAPVVALKAAVMTLLSIGVSFGVITAMLQWGWGLDLVGVDKTVPIMSAVPMLLFVVLFGLSMDYEVFLLSAIRESYEKTGDPRRAVIAGLSSTAGVITAAAIITACVFLSFVSVPETLIKIIGIWTGHRRRHRRDADPDGAGARRDGVARRRGVVASGAPEARTPRRSPRVAVEATVAPVGPGVSGPQSGSDGRVPPARRYVAGGARACVERLGRRRMGAA